MYEFVAAQPLGSAALRCEPLAGRALDLREGGDLVGRNEPSEHRRAQPRRRDQPDGSRKRFADNRQAIEQAVIASVSEAIQR